MMINAEQQQAASVTSKHALILAGPGTGKTTTLVARYQHLINQGVKPQAILCCTFARKASDELKERIQKQVGVNTKTLPIGTFHALANRAVKSLAHLLDVEIPKTVLKEFERRKIIQGFASENQNLCKNLKHEDRSPLAILSSIDGFRDQLMSPEEASIDAGENGDEIQSAHAEFYALYEQYLSENALIDYARMIQFAVNAFTADADGDKNYVSQYQHILVDEFQDINYAQKCMLDQLLRGGASLWVVGDDDQAIYGWRGSSVKYILNFDRYFAHPEIVTLTQNYRASAKLVKSSNYLASNFLERREKELSAVSDDKGEIFTHHHQDAAQESREIAKLLAARNKLGIPFEDMAVLARTNALPSELVETLLFQGIPVSLKNGVEAFHNIYAKQLVTAIGIASSQNLTREWNRKIGPNLFGFAKRLQTEDGWQRKVKALATSIINNLPKGMSDDELSSTVAEIEKCREFFCKFDNAQTAFLRLNAGSQDNKDTVHVGTIHGSKGLEWNTVIIMGCEDDILPHSLSVELKEIEEERRVFYVGITRAKRYLSLSYCDERNGVDKNPSPYLAELEANAGQVSYEYKYVADIPKLNAGDKYSDKESIARRKRLERVLRVAEEMKKKKAKKPAISENIADGYGESDGWALRDIDKGFLLEVGYTARQGGPNTSERQGILADVFHGRIHMPDTIRDSVSEKWGKPNSIERLRKMRNNINVSIGTQKARGQPSIQAIEKWEADLEYIDNELKTHLEDEK